MKLLLIAQLLLSSAIAKPDSKAAKYGKAGKFSKAEGKAAKSAGYYGRSLSMSASMSVGPEPEPPRPSPRPSPRPTTLLTGCGESSFTDEKVVLSEDLDCGPRVGDQQTCAVKLDGPQAEIDCKGNTLSQVANHYNDGPFFYGICLSNGAKARNCNVKQFYEGIDVRNGGEVVNSVLRFNLFGVLAAFSEDATLTIENT